MAISAKTREAQEQASWIRRMFEEGARMKQQRGEENVFDFSLGNPCLDPPAAYLQGIREELELPPAGRYGYMPNAGYPETREAVAAELRRRRGIPFEGKHVVMTCGAAGGLNVVFKTLLDPGEEVILPVPCFAEYFFYVDNHQGVCRTAETRSDFSLDLEAIAAAISGRTKAVLINSPNNPTGKMYDRESIAGLGALLQEASERLGKTLYLISDEPYGDILFDGRVLPDLFSCYRSSILVNSYSKSLSIPGERLGYVALHPEIEDLDGLLGGLSFCNRTLGYVNAPATAQRVIRKVTGARVDAGAYQRRRDLLCSGLDPAGYQYVKPDGAFYLFPKSPVPDDILFVKALLDEGVLVVPGTGFRRPGHFRIAYCVDESVIRRALPVFARVRSRFP